MKMGSDRTRTGGGNEVYTFTHEVSARSIRREAARLAQRREVAPIRRLHEKRVRGVAR